MADCWQAAEWNLESSGFGKLQVEKSCAHFKVPDMWVGFPSVRMAKRWQWVQPVCQGILRSYGRLRTEPSCAHFKVGYLPSARMARCLRVVEWTSRPAGP